MTVEARQNPFPHFTDGSGNPLASGYVYFGQANKDPRQFPVTVYYDAALTLPATQPLRTTAGYLYRNGSPTNVYMDGSCSVMVLDSAQRQVSYAAQWIGVADAAAASSAASAAASLVSANASAASATNALTSVAQAAINAAMGGVYANSANANVPRGLTQASVGAITPGATGTNGTFALAWSGGNFSINPTGTFTVAGGVLTAVTITGPGLYIGAAPTVPTPSFAASTGLAGAAVALTAQFLATAGQGYWVQSLDGNTLDRYKNVAGVATSDAANVNPIGTAEFTLHGFKGVVETTGTTTVLTTTTQLGAPYIVTPFNPTTKLAYLETISVRFTLGTGPAYAAIFVFEPISGAQYLVTKEWRVKLVNGLNTFSAPNDFDPYLLPIGSRIGFKVLSGSTLNIDVRSEIAANSSRVFIGSDVTGVGATPSYSTADPTPPLFTPMLSWTTVHFDKLFGDDFSTLPDLLAGNNITKTQTADVVRGKTSISRTLFSGTTTPTGWALGGGAVSNGLTFASPGASAYARYDTPTSANYTTCSAKFVVTDNTTAKFGIGYSPQSGENGGYIEIDATANTLSAMQWQGAGSTPGTLASFGKTVAIPALVAGRTYVLTVRRRGLANTIEWRDYVTQAVTTLNSPFTANTHDMLASKAGFLHRAGSANGVKCTYFEFASLFEKPKVIVLGDSNAHAAALGPSFTQYKPLEWKSAWPYLLDAARGRGDVINASTPGNTSGSLAARLATDLNVWNPDFVVLPMGTNDTVQGTWRTNMQTVITAILARGATPVMCTYPPRTGVQAFIDSINADILANFFGNYPILDIAFALTASNDRVNWNTAFDVGDHIHFNVDGHAAVFNQVKLDCPFLLLQ